MSRKHNSKCFTSKNTDALKNDDNSSTKRDYYFDSYAHFGIHEQMLKDSVRTQAYRDAMFNNKHLFKHKIVLDVGCGTGILSLFAAKAGAKKVYAVENSDIVDQAKSIVVKNCLSEVITVIRGKIEEVELPVDKVDIIISEWMGYCLYFESMLDSVIFARDKWLKDHGLIFPERVTLYLCAIEDSDYKEYKFGFWDDVHGFDMSRLKKLSLNEPIVKFVDKERVASNSCLLREFNLGNGRKQDIPFLSEFQLKLERDDYINALVSYFNVEFALSYKKVELSTSPMSKHYTHWKQTVFYLKDDMTCKKDECIYGLFKLSPNQSNRRDLDIDVQIDFEGELSNLHEFNKYKMR